MHKRMVYFHSSRKREIHNDEENTVNRLKIFTALALFLSAFHAAGLSSRVEAQFLVNKIKPTTDLADIPFNRPEPKHRWEPEKNAFFPSLLGLGTPGARAIRTKYFAIYYTSAENTARRIAEVADDIFEGISSHYPTSIDRFAPVHVYVDDSVDYLGNAYSAYFYNFIMFWSTPAAFDTRGTKDWIRDVFTHELTHHITLKAAHNSLPFMFGIISTSQANQNPDFTFTAPLYHLAVPSWFSEGIAQYESRKNNGDYWDTHRDMLLRMATLEDDLHSYSNMGVFSKDSFHSEMVYNQGFALLNYVEETYGEEAVRAMAEKRPIVNFKSAVKKSLGVSANQLYREWTEHLGQTYGALADTIRAAGEREGELIYDGGSMEYHPVYSPDGAKVAFLSNDGSDYNSLTRLMVMDLTTLKVKKVAHGRKYGKYTGNRFSWTPDGSKLVYNKTPGGRWDIFTYDLDTKKERRLTVGLRGRDPAVSPDGKQIAFVNNRDGTNSLGLVNIDGTNMRFLTHHNDGTQYYAPQWSPDGKKLLFSVFRKKDRDIAIINADAATLKAKANMKKFRASSGKKKKTKHAKPDSAKAASDSTEAVPDSIRIAQRQKALEDSLKDFPDSLAFANNANFEALLRSGADERDPVWLPDGSGIVFSSNRTGVFNLYTYDLATGRQEQLTNLIGGAFAPSVSPDGNDILYAGYHNADYSLYRIQRSLAVTVAAADTLSRDYRSIYTGEDLDELYNVGRYSNRLISYGIMPILVLGPTFVGNRFGLDQISAGAQMAWGDLLGSDNLVTGFTIGKNLRRRTDLNSDLFVSYQKSLPGISTELKSYRPRLFIGASRQTINSLVDRGVIASQRDTASGTLITVIDSQQVIIPRATQHTNLSLTEEDDYKHLFTDFSVGTNIGVGRNQAITLAYSHRRYSENLQITQVIQDSSRVFQADAQTGALTDITDQIPGTGVDQVVLDDFLYRDLTFFKSNDLSVSWRYATFKPAKDQYLNPTGGRAITFRYRRTNATITDSLALSTDLNQDNVPDPTATDPTPTLFREDNVKLGINEYVASWNEFIALPGRTTLALQAFMGYKDKPIKRVQLDGGAFEGAFYYPLRYYLGGFGTLRGYPYFSTAGGKAVFGRASFTFPIFQKVDKELPPFFFDKIYGVFFLETGATGDFARLKDIFDGSKLDINKDAFLTDWGFELRMHMFSNYGLSMFGYFQIAFPTRKQIPDRNDPTFMQDIDSRRIYFGFSI